MDPVNHPTHYQGTNGIETIEAIEAAMSKEAFKGYIQGNVIKYVMRYERKNGAEDLYKAQWYLNRLIDIIETTQNVETTESNGECKDGFCPMPNVRHGAPQAMFAPVN